jgi:hypothetical protein
MIYANFIRQVKKCTHSVTGLAHFLLLPVDFQFVSAKF